MGVNSHTATGSSQKGCVSGWCVQVLVDCVKANGSNGCSGGDPTAAYSYILDHGIPDETCSNYEVCACLPCLCLSVRLSVHLSVRLCLCLAAFCIPCPYTHG